MTMKHTDECFEYAAKTRRAFCITSCADARRRSPAMMTFEDALEIVRAIVRAAEIIRRRYLNEECDCCGVSYHPRHGKPPPRENKRTCRTARAHALTDPDACWCGHAGMREMWQYWDRKTNDWRPDT